MKKVIALLMGMLLMVTGAFADGALESIQDMTDLAEIQEKMNQGVTIESAYYTDGFGFSTSEFTTDDPEEIALLWDAVNAMMVGEEVNESITDWYPQIVFNLSDGTQGGVRFEGRWLSIDGMKNYEISGAEEFWNLTSALVGKYTRMEETAIIGGWACASDSTITDEIQAMFDKGMGGLVGVNYTPVTYLGAQVVAGYNHAILCQGTVVYPGASPYWAIVYLFEDLDGNVTVTNIKDLDW